MALDFSAILLDLFIFLPPALFVLFLVLTIVNWKKNKKARIIFLILTIIQSIALLIEIGLFIMLSIAVAHM